MHRRSFLKTVLAASAALALPASASVRPQIVLTMDDPKTDLDAPMAWPEANKRLLGALNQRKLKAALFVCGKRVDSPEGGKLLSEWDAAGHLICNHTYSHPMYLKRTSFDAFAEDFRHDEPVIEHYRNFTKLFRYPFLKEGDTAEKRDGFRALLKERGYRVGHVTVDASDWYVDQRLRERLKKSPDANTEPYRDYLVSHLLDRAGYYRKLAVDVLGREIPHTLLVHYTYINALFLIDVLKAFEDAGWEWIDADRGYKDRVFSEEPKTVPAGESLVWALASATGRYKDKLRWPGEDGDYEKPKMDALGL